MDQHFDKIDTRHPELLQNVRQILINAQCTSPERNMTLAQIRAAYKQMHQQEFPRIGEPRVEVLLFLRIPYVACFTNAVGTFRFYLTQMAES